MSLLEIDSVSVHFGGVHALRNVELTVEQGSRHCIIGPNGAGKSTLVNVLTGQIRPDSGGVRFAGQSLVGRKPHDIYQLGIARVFQSPAIFAERSVLENVTVAAFARNDGKFALNLLRSRREMAPAYEQAREKLAEVGLDERRDEPAGHLSRGDKRRLELAVCLAAEPPLLLLDEPTSGMSRHETESTVDLLGHIGGSGVTMVIIEHDMSLVFSLAERLTVLHEGQVIADGPPETVRGDPAVVEAYLGESQQ